MRNNIIKWISFLSLILLIGTGCQDQTEVYEEFVVSGGNVYPGVMVNPTVLSGDNRVQIVGSKPMGADVNEVRVFWNYFTDSVSFPLNQTTPKNLEIEIAGLKEQSYLFTVHSYNSFGDKSVPVELFGKSYGNKYAATLSNRDLILAAYNSQGEVDFTFDEAFEGTLYSEIRYTNNNQEPVSVRVPANQPGVTIVDYNPAKPLQCITAYKPDTTCIDTFFCELSEDIKVEFPAITIEDLSSQHKDGADARFRATNVLDGIIENSGAFKAWHTKVGLTYPHWLTLDLGIVRSISRIEIFRYPGDARAMSKFTLETSSDNQNWSSQGEFDFNYTKDGGQMYELPVPVNTRYIKLTGTAPGEAADFLVLGEIVIHE